MSHHREGCIALEGIPTGGKMTLQDFHRALNPKPKHIRECRAVLLRGYVANTRQIGEDTFFITAS